MYLFKRSNGIYYIKYQDKNGKTKSVSTKAKKKTEALLFLSTYSEELKVKEKLHHTPITLKKFCWEFLKYSERMHTEKTLKTYKVTFKCFQNFLGNCQLTEISSKIIANYIEYRSVTPSKHQARKDYINLSSSFNWAIDKGFLITNPCTSVKKPKPPEKLPNFFTEGEFNKLLTVIDNIEFKALVKLAVNTGLRQMELLELRWHQINLAERIILLDNQLHVTKGKKIRSIPLNQDAVNVLIDLQNENTVRSKYVFEFPNITNRWKYVQNNMRKYIDKSNINSKLNFHALRATFASWMVQRGVPIYQVSKLLGHSDLKTTLIYAHLRQDDLVDAVKKLE